MDNSICRCCLYEGLNKNLYSSYNWNDKNEIYSEMLQECFNINLAPATQTAGICDSCINCLRTSYNFKQQVLNAEQDFLKRLQEVDDEKDVKLVEIKLEPKKFDSGDESDDYFLADAARESSLPKIKTEKDPPLKKKHERKGKVLVKKTATSDGKWRKEKKFPRLTTSINPCDLPDIKPDTKKPSKSKLKITTKDKSYDKKVNVIWSRPSHIDKQKHKENLQTILNYSNVTPFRKKTLLGFMCGYCETSYPDPLDLRHHTNLDHKKERLEFKSNFDMAEYNVKVDITDLICTLCDEKIENLANLKEHLMKIHEKIIHEDIKDHILQFKLKKGDVYDCAMCPSTYETFKMLKQHMNKHYSNYQCLKCDTAFATKRSLSAHRETHQEGSFKCDHCDKVFTSRSKKHYHQKMKHFGARNISNCPYCNEPFRSYYQRNQHLVKVHNTEAQYKCNVCNKAYILKTLLMYHIKKNHLMEKNCQCTECGFRFFSKKALKAHMVKHTGERIYVCEVCHKSYARKYTLREHMRIHNNDRRFKCSVCGQAFVQKCSLKSHMLSNHGISVAAADITST